MRGNDKQVCDEGEQVRSFSNQVSFRREGLSLRATQGAPE